MRRATDGSGDGMMNIQEGKQVRNEGHQDGATTNRHGNQPQPLPPGRRHHGSPWAASRGSPHQVKKAALNEGNENAGKDGGKKANEKDNGRYGRGMEGLHA